MSLTVIQSPTAISESFVPAAVTTLANGNYVVTYTPFVNDILIQAEIVALEFDPTGQVVASVTLTQTHGFDDTTEVAVGGLAGGGFALAWDAQSFPPLDLIGTQVFAADGTATSSQSSHSYYTDNLSQVVTPLANGGYALTWTSSATGAGQIVTTTFDAQGLETTPIIQVSDAPAGATQFLPAHAASADGYALAFSQTDIQSTRSDAQVFFASFDAQGNEIGTPVDISQSVTSDLGFSSVQMTALSNGDYALAFDSSTNAQFDAFQPKVWTAIVDANGTQVAAPTLVDHDVVVVGSPPQIVALANGEYALAWEGNNADIYTAVYNAQGQQVAAPVDVSLAPGDSPQLVTLSNGDYALAWQSDSGGIATAVFNPQGQEVAAPVVVDSDPNDFFSGYTQQLTALANGEYVITWETPGSFLFFDTHSAIYQFSDSTGVSDVNYVGTSDITLDLSAIFNVAGNVTISGNDQLVSIDLSHLLSVGGNFTLTDNGKLLTIDLPSLTTVSGSVTITNETSATTIDAGSLVTVSGDVTISDNTSATNIDVGSLTTVSGSVTIAENTNADTIDAGSLATVSGSVSITDNSSATSVDAGNLISSGSVDISGNASAITIDLSALISAGAIVISDNGVITLDLSALLTAGGDVSITDNTHLLTVDLPSLTSVDGSVTITNETSATTIDAGGLTTISGDVTISDNTSATTIDVGSLTDVSGSVTIADNTGADTIDAGSLTTVSGSVSIADNSSATGVDAGSLTSSGSVDISGNTDATTIDAGSLTTVTGSVSITDNSSATTIDAGSLTTVSGDVTITSSADATLDASLLGPGGGTVELIGDNLSTTITLGSLDHLGGTLTISSADGVTLTSHAGLTELDITGTSHDDTLIGSLTAKNVIDAGAGNDLMSGGSADDSFVFDFSVSQHTESHHDFVSLAHVNSVTLGGTTYVEPALTGSITAWKVWDNALTTYANSQADNTGGDQFTAFTNSNPVAKNEGSIKLIDGYFHDYNATVTNVAGEGFDTITNFANPAFTVTNGGGGNDVLLFNGLSNDPTAANYWVNVLSSTTANGNTTIHVHDVADSGADVSSITLLGVTTDVTSLVQKGAIQFDAGFHLT